MAEQQVKVVINGEDKSGSAFRSATGNVDGFSKRTSVLDKDVSGLAKTLGAATVAVGALAVAFGVSAVKGYMEAEAVQTRLVQILRTSTGATNEQIASLTAQAEALEKVGVVSAEVIKQGQGQLASFDLQAESIEKLIPSILNYAVAEKGANLASGDLQSVTNGLAQALQGNFASLTKTGFVLDENTRALISNGTETEKVAALASVLDSTYAGMNETMRATTQGSIVGMQFAMENLRDTFGAALATAITPFIVELSAWASDPDVQKKITEISTVIGEFATVAIPVMIDAIKIMYNWFTAITNVLGEIIYQINRAIEAIGRFASASKKIGSNVVSSVKGIFGKEIGGSVASSTPYLVGERGPELFVPSSFGRIIPNNQFAGAGGGITINISGNTLLDKSAGEKISNQIMQALKNNLRI